MSAPPSIAAQGKPPNDESFSGEFRRRPTLCCQRSDRRNAVALHPEQRAGCVSHGRIVFHQEDMGHR